MPRHARLDALVVRLRRVLKGHALPPKHVDGSIDVLGSQRDVLDPLPVILPQVLLDLALVVLRLIDRNPDLPARARHGAREQARLLPLDVEVPDLPEVEELLVEAGPR